MNFIRSTIFANLTLLFVFAFLPVLMFKPDLEVFQNLLVYLNNE